MRNIRQNFHQHVRNVITVTNFWGRTPYESFQWVPTGHSSGLGACNVPYKTHRGKEAACIIKVEVIRRKRFKGEATYWKINNLADQNWTKMFALLADRTLLDFQFVSTVVGQVHCELSLILNAPGLLAQELIRHSQNLIRNPQFSKLLIIQLA